MSGINETDANFIFDLESNRPGDLASRQLEWAYRVFAEPTATGGNTNFAALEKDKIEPAVEASLYTNLQSRDSEVGVALLDWRKLELREVIKVVQEGLTKRERSYSVSRARLEALEKINTSEPNPQLRYGAHVFDEIKAQMITDQRELAYLKEWQPALESLDLVLQALDESGRANRTNEQMMRLLGQSFRAQARLRAFAGQFRESINERLPKLPAYTHEKGFGGYLLTLSDNSTIVVDLCTAAYLRHLLEVINQLSEVSREFLQNRVSLPENCWFPLLALLRAIVEFFYICNFELPFINTSLAIDGQDTKQTWQKVQTGQWQTQPEQTDSNRYLKRIGCETAQLINKNGALLKCNSRDELNRFLKREAPPLSNTDANLPEHFPYYCCGLAEYDLNPENQRVKLHTAFNSISTIIKQLLANQSDCTSIRSSALGGPVETMLGMAEFDPRAFGLTGEVRALAGMERTKLLSLFWRTMGRRRAISMLGDDYAKRVTRGMEAIGQPGPEHPTFLSVVFKPTMASIALGKVEPFTDPFSALNLADQVRLLELLNITWTVSNDFLDRLKDVHSQGKLKRIIEALPQLAEEQQQELQKRFNPKWLQSTTWIWSLLRSCAPNLWDFWGRSNDPALWQKIISQPPLKGLSLLLQIFSETTRLILLIEASGSGLAERLTNSAELCGQAIMAGVQGYLEGSAIPAALGEAINYYFDPEVRFDSWLAFTTSFHSYLRQTERDLRAMNASQAHINGLGAIIEQLDLIHPVDQKTAQAEPPVEVVIIPPIVNQPQIIGAITEADAELFARIFYELLQRKEDDTLNFLKLLSMLARKETQDFLYGADRIHALITRLLPDHHQRVLLFTLPTTTRTFFNFLLTLEAETRAEDGQLESLKHRSQDYFEQLKQFAQSLSSVTERLPHLVPSDREALDNFINASGPANRDLPFLMMFACDQLVMDICASSSDRTYQVESAVGKMRAYLREQMGSQFEEPSIEIFPFGGGRIACRGEKFFLTGGNESFELAFAEPDQAMSNYLLTKVASIKFSFAAQILRNAYPKLHFIAQV